MSTDLVPPTTTTVLVETATGAQVLPLPDDSPGHRRATAWTASLMCSADRRRRPARLALASRLEVRVVPQSPSVEPAPNGVDAEVSAPGVRVAPATARRPVQPPVVTS